MFIVVTISKNKITKMRKFSSEKEAVNEFLKTVKHISGKKHSLLSKNFSFDDVSGEKYLAVTYENSIETIQLFGIKDFSEYTKNLSFDEIQKILSWQKHIPINLKTLKPAYEKAGWLELGTYEDTITFARKEYVESKKLFDYTKPEDTITIFFDEQGNVRWTHIDCENFNTDKWCFENDK